MQVAGECFANSEKSYHAAVTILKIKFNDFFGIWCRAIRKSFGEIAPTNSTFPTARSHELTLDIAFPAPSLPHVVGVQFVDILRIYVKFCNNIKNFA